MKYDIEADWQLLNTCNFRCAYCFISPEKLGSRITIYGSHSDWQAAFDATGKTWLFHITGGEPFVYPGFVSLCEHLTHNHYLSINTNLSRRTAVEFSERIDPQRVHYINAAVHPEERQTRQSLDSFLELVDLLRKRNFVVLPSVVMTPRMIPSFPALARRFVAWGVYPIPKALRSTHEGKLYPDAYDPAQKAAIRQYLSNAQEWFAADIERMKERPTIDIFSDSRFLDRLIDYRGKLCGSGHTFVRIRPDGTVVRCGSGQSLGNVLKRDVQFLTRPQPCDTSYCPYFCEKYTSPPFVPSNADHACPPSSGVVARIQRLLGLIRVRQPDVPHR